MNTCRKTSIAAALFAVAAALAAQSPDSGPAAGGTPITIPVFPDEAHCTPCHVSIGGVDATNVYGRSYVIHATTPALAPGTLNDLDVTYFGPPIHRPDFWLADFLDVPEDDGFHAAVETMRRAGITAGCGGGDFCRNVPVLRKQLAVFLLKAKNGPSFVPPSCSPDDFADVPCPGPFSDWISWACITVMPCHTLVFGPDEAVRRDEMAFYLLRSRHGMDYRAPACTPPGRFADAPCPGNWTDWIEQLAAEGITGGCGGGNYCPDRLVTRGQVAALIVRAFALP